MRLPFLPVAVSLLMLLALSPLALPAATNSGNVPAGSTPAPPVSTWATEAGVRRGPLGLHVAAVDGSHVLASVSADKPLNPASVIKLITGWVALGTLGQDYRWQTRFFLDGPLDSDGTLHGNLLIVGGGDPKLVVEDLTDLAGRLRAHGLQHIAGDLLLDDSLYETSGQRAGTFDGQVSEPYNVRPNAAMMNFKATKFTLTPRAGRVAVELDPPLAGVRIDNQLRLVKGRCRHRARDIGVHNAGSEWQPVIRLTGKYSAGCRTQWSFHAVLNHRQFVDAFFRAGWLAAGGTLAGKTRFATGYLAGLSEGQRDAQPEPWFTWQSPRTLADVVTDINKFSNNVMTRQLVLHLGASRGVTPASRDEGLSAVRAYLALQGLHLPELVIDNGSGLSRRTRVSARSLTRVLQRIWTSPQGAVMRDSLPVAGVDGTMRWRLNKTPVVGHAWLKTGSLDGVRSIAGYVRGDSGQVYALTMMVNGRDARRSMPMQDALVLWVRKNG